MCGRTSCSLCPERYECATSYYDPTLDQYKKPHFESSSNTEFKPSTNIAPTEVTPVLVWNAKESAPVLKPMTWGLIPSWADNNYSSSKYHTHNCRIESLTETPLYKPVLKKGKRCVMVCEGYYEWQTTGAKNKSPAFIYVKQPEEMRVEETSCWESGTWSAQAGWKGPSLTCMAGLYSIWESPLKGEVMSYAVVTMPSSPALSWLHHRMPAILSTPEEIKAWLNYEDIDGSEALQNLHQSESVSWHFVSSAVNNSRNKSPECNKPVDEKKSNQTSLTSWFTKKSSKRNSDTNENFDDSVNKKTKN